MGNSENGNSPRSEKSSSPATLTNPTNIHMYPDWAAIQAHYGPSVAIPPYYNFPVASGHAPHHYIWPTHQPIMPPYGTSYAAVYANGNFYAHPIVPFITAAQMNMERPANSKENAQKGLMKKLKSFDGLAMSLGNCGTESGAEDTMSQSVETGGSSNASDGHLATASRCFMANEKKSEGSLHGTPSKAKTEKTETKANPSFERKVKIENRYDSLSNPAVQTIVLPAISKSLEQTSHLGLHFETTPINGQREYTAVLSEPCSQNEREVKRERRKQSNRESARRSRLRKQVEAEELARKVEFLYAENLSIKSEISQIAEKSEKLKLQNASLMGRLNNTESGCTEELVDKKRVQLICTENLLSRVSNSDSVIKEESKTYPKNSHQLLNSRQAQQRRRRSKSNC